MPTDSEAGTATLTREHTWAVNLEILEEILLKEHTYFIHLINIHLDKEPSKTNSRG